MKITNLTNLPEEKIVGLKSDLAEHKTLGQVLAWAAQKPKNEFLPQIVAEVITQDEFTHDVVIQYKSVFLVYDTT